MPLIPVMFRPGLFMNSTEHGRKGRWADGERVRWRNDAIEPIGGWGRRTDYSGVDIPALTLSPTTEKFRDAETWLDNNNARRYIFGSNDSLVILQADETVDTVTPAGWTGSGSEPTVSTGYGTWLYGRSTYGTPRPVDPTATTYIYRWNFDTWGEDIIAGAGSPNYADTLYLYDTSTDPAALTAISGAPLEVHGFVVTDQRIVMAIGDPDDARKVSWCDREDYTDWVSTDSNWAGAFILQGSGELMSIKKVLNQVLIVSETDAHVARYVGAPYVYGFDRVGNDCGAWSGGVVHVTDRFAMWPGQKTFWMYDGTLRPVHCEIQDFLTDDVDQTQAAKFWVTGVPNFNEIWWFYQCKDGDEVDSYVSYDYVQNIWSKGRLPRTCGVEGDGIRNSVMVDSDDQVIYEHEQYSVVVSDTYLESGPIEISQGEYNVAVDYIYPDTDDIGDATFTLKGRQFPNAAEVSAGPYNYTSNPVPTRLMAREVRLYIDGDDNTRWTVGPGTRLSVPSVHTGKR